MHAVFSNKIQMHPTLCTPISATGDKKPGLFVGDAPLHAAASHQVHWWRRGWKERGDASTKLVTSH